MFLSLCVTTSLAAGGVHPKPGNTSHATGKGNNGHQQKQHQTHSGKWKGGKKKHWHNGMNMWLYWSPADSCWYRYDAATDTYVPCDDLTVEDIDD